MLRKKELKMLILGAHISFSSIFLFPLLWYLHLKLRVEQIRNWPQASTNCSLLLKKKKKTGPWKAKEIQRWGSTKVYWAEARRGFWFFQKFPLVLWLNNLLQSVVERSRATAETQERVHDPESFSAIYQNSSAPWECLATYVPLKNRVANQGVIAMTCEEQDL